MLSPSVTGLSQLQIYMDTFCFNLNKIGYIYQVVKLALPEPKNGIRMWMKAQSKIWLDNSCPASFHR